MSSVITALSWAPKGAAAQHPKKAEFDEEAYKRIQPMLDMNLKAANASLALAQQRALELAEDADSDNDDSDGAMDLDDELDNMEADSAENIKPKKSKQKAKKTETEEAPAAAAAAAAAAPSTDESDRLAKYNLDSYDDDDDGIRLVGEDSDEEFDNDEDEEDDEDEDDEDDDMDMSDDSEDDDEEGKVGNAGNFLSSMNNLSVETGEDGDPYLIMKGAEEYDSELDLEEDAEIEIEPTDNVLFVSKTEDGISQLEMHVFVEDENRIYVHHDVLLSSMPICCERIDFRVNQQANNSSNNSTAAATASSLANIPGNYVAVGTLEPTIEIWDMDEIDAIYPHAMLGPPAEVLAKQAAAQEAQAKKTGKKKKKMQITIDEMKPNPNYHVDAVMCLSWNRNHRNFLASGSADCTIKLWDLNEQKAVRSFNHHSDKVQAVQWHATETTHLLTGSYDKTATVFDTRSADSIQTYQLGSDVECLLWDPHSPHHFYATTEQGLVMYFDKRQNKLVSKNMSQAIYTLDASTNSPVSAFDVSPSVPGCFITGSDDGVVKVWDASDSKPSMVASRNVGVGRVFTAKFCPDSHFKLAVGGSNGVLHLWDIVANQHVRKALSNKHPQLIAEIDAKIASAEQAGNMRPADGLIGVTDFDADGDDDDDQDSDLEDYKRGGSGRPSGRSTGNGNRRNKSRDMSH
ncbi:WD40 repeat-like protein [Ramicandelaber brevisporus]|nr:WD40 repeat-like protein [Ramicandelaber brevisporus]